MDARMKIDLSMVTEDPQEVANLEEFMGLLINGMPTRQAVGQVWPNAAPRHYVSDVNGSLIGWDTCGGCNKHVSRCTEPDGPSEPAYFARLREEDAARKAIAAGENPTVARTSAVANAASSPAPSESASSTSGPTEEASSASPESSESAATPSRSMVPCAPGKHLVPEAEAERNDDGSWTCFDCQAGAAARGSDGAPS